MATPLDLQEQEQLDALKSFWKQYGNLIIWVVTLVLAAYAAWNGWNLWQARQGTQAGAMYEELEKAVKGGDAEKTTRIFNDLKERYGRTAYGQQGGLLAARLQYDKGQFEAAIGTLGWVVEHGDAQYRDIARLRLAGVLLDRGQLEPALKALEAVEAPEFAGLAADRRGDVLLNQTKKAEAKAAYEAAWKALPATQEYRSIVEAKLAALGAEPPASAASGAAK
jgi:predicted negative regulator of RcsB-dependent stress response